MNDSNKLTPEEIEIFKKHKAEFATFPLLTIYYLMFLIGLFLWKNPSRLTGVVDTEYIFVFLALGAAGLLSFYSKFQSYRRAKGLTPENLQFYTGTLKKNRSKSKDYVKLVTSKTKIPLGGNYDYNKHYINHNVKVFVDDNKIYVIRMI